MALTYLDSAMIENPAFFQQLSAARLSAVIFNSSTVNNSDNIFTVGLSVQSLTADLADSNFINNSGDIINASGDIFTLGLSAQSLTASLINTDIINNSGDIITIGLSVQSLTASLINTDIINNSGDIITIGLSVQNLTADADIFNSKFINNSNDILTVGLSVQNLTADRITFGPREEIANTLYVSVSGDDNNSGRNIFEPLRTIKKACEITHNTLNSRPGAIFTIFVGTGDYTEENPIFVPKNTTLIGDNLRRTTIRPLSSSYDILWCNNSVYVWGFTFRGHKNGAAATAYPNFSNPTLTAIALQNLTTPTSTYNMVFPGASQGEGWKKPYIVTSPYIQGCSSITNAVGAVSAGCGMRIDGSLAEGFLRSFVLDSYTQFNEGGKGIHIINNGYAQLVSIFTICCTEGIHAESGGSCSINTSNCSFGLSGVVATGKSPQPILSGALVENPQGTNQIRIPQSTTHGLVIYPDSVLAPRIAFAPYNGLVFTIGNDPTIFKIDGNPTLSSTNTGTEFVIDTIDSLSASYEPNEVVNFYIRSTVTTSSHTFEYIGSGTTLVSAVPSLGGVGDFAKEAVFDDVGVVYFTSTNQAGNFRVGNEFTIVQETGVIEGDTFKRAILTLVTPLILSLE